MQHIPSTALRDARLELHYAAQVVAACADAWLTIRADDGHTAMEWERPRMIGALSPSGIALGVDLAAFAIIGYAARRQDVSFPLAGTRSVTRPSRRCHPSRESGSGRITSISARSSMVSGSVCRLATATTTSRTST